MGRVLYTCRLFTALIVPILVIYNAAEINGIGSAKGLIYPLPGNKNLNNLCETITDC